MLVKKILNKLGLIKDYSNFGEEERINYFLEHLDHKKIAVDIAAHDGVFMSNTYKLYKAGYSGLAVECDDVKFSSLASSYKKFGRVSLSKTLVYPDNVIKLLEGNEIPYDFGFLSFDIDGYDYFVLNELLKKYRPTLICAEINEKIPYPIKFTVRYDRNYMWEVNHFFGQSIGQLYTLCEKYDYDLVELYYNNVFLVPKEKNLSLTKLNPEEAYLNGYVNKSDRKKKFPYNKDVDVMLEMEPEEALKFLNIYFKKYEGKYQATI
ncbi:hypothetical protein ACMA1I_09055 [Pontibacter sp. 13R65]|uniref:hypothetical protein n=1 Tax=Pontibacter sp. 13R65 TaxID=3127458 RepID=UPI00301CE1CA